MRFNEQVGMEFDLRAWAKPKPGDTLDDLAALMEELGNEVVAYDHENNRLELKIKD